MKIKISNRLIFKVSAVVILIQIAVFTSIGIYYSRRFASEIDHRIESNIRLPGVLMTRQLLRYESVADQEMMTELVGEEFMDGLVVGPDGKIYFARKPEYVGKSVEDVSGLDVRWFDVEQPHAKTIHVAGEGETYLVSVTPLFAYGAAEPFFFVYIKTKTTKTEAEKTRVARFFALSALFCVCLTSMAIIFLIRRMVIFPIQGLEQNANNVANGDLDQTIRVDRDDELGGLARCFSRMRDAVREQISQLDELNRELEQRVEEKTASLKTHVERLREEIEERKRAEEALRESNEKLTALIDASPMAIIVLDRDGNVTLWNAAAEDIFGWTAKEAIGRFLPLVPEEKKEEHRKLRERVLNGEGFFGVEAVRRKKNGAEIHISISTVPLKDSEGAISGIMSVSDDITDRVRAEMQLQEYSERLEEKVAERTRELEAAQAELILKERLAVLGHFAGSISHELRNPLGAIDASVYFLGMKFGGGDEKTKQHLGRIHSNVKKSTAIIESLLNLSRMEKPKTKRIDLTGFLPEALRTVNIPETVKTNLDLSEVSVFVDIDPEQIRMALKNIVQNAVQAMDGSGTLTIAASPTIGDVEISVTDTGPGIPPEYMEKVFEPLFSTKTHGIGFGLSITKMIVENHGGTIRALSDPGNGATFLMILKKAEEREHDNG